MKTFSKSTKNTCAAFQDLLNYAALYIFSLLILVFYLRNEEIEFLRFIILIISLFFFVIHVLPVLIIYLNYDQHNSGLIVILTKEGFKANSEFIAKENIKEITIIGTHQHFHKGRSFIGYEEGFFYMEIMLVDNRKYFLTSLLGPEIDLDFIQEFSEINIKKQIKAFPRI